MTHRELCIKGAKYLKNHGIQPFHKCQYVVCELERVGECPDDFGFGGSTTQLLEIKVSRPDFLSDKNKYWRKNPEYGIGEFRAYLCPDGIIKEFDLPENWGLYYISENNKITEIKQARPQACNRKEEINLITSILRREGIPSKIFSYKKYVSDTTLIFDDESNN